MIPMNSTRYYLDCIGVWGKLSIYCPKIRQSLRCSKLILGKTTEESTTIVVQSTMMLFRFKMGKWE